MGNEGEPNLTIFFRCFLNTPKGMERSVQKLMESMAVRDTGIFFQDTKTHLCFEVAY